MRPVDDPDALRLAAAMSAEVSAREAHADDTAVEQLKSLTEAIGPDGEVLVAFGDGEAVAIGAFSRHWSGGDLNVVWDRPAGHARFPR